MMEAAKGTLFIFHGEIITELTFPPVRQPSKPNESDVLKKT